MKRLFKSLLWAKHGIKTVAKEEANFQIEIAVAIVAVMFGFVFSISKTDWLFLVLAIVLVLTAEIVNTAIEDLCNKIEPNPNKEIGKIKDIMAGFVLLSSLGATIIGIMIFFPFFF